MKRTQRLVGGSVLGAAVALGTWALAVPAGVAELLDEAFPGVSLGSGSSAEIPQGTILVFGPDGTLDEVVADEQTPVYQLRNEAMHNL